MQPNDPLFDDFTNMDGRWTLQDAVAETGSRPMLGAADAIMTSEGQGDFYQVAWRAKRVENPNQLGTFDSRRIVVMVRYATPGGFRQVTMWVVKYDPEAISLGTGGTFEI
jgi:type IV pilus assembly protein PilV